MPNLFATPTVAGTVFSEAAVYVLLLLQVGQSYSLG